MSWPVTARRSLIVLRHGRTAWNVERRFQGQHHEADPPLDEVGEAQAIQAGIALAKTEATVLLSSPLRRARQTADAVSAASGLTVVEDARLAEQAFGRWEGLTRDEVAERYPDEFAVWTSGQEPQRRGGETRAEAGRRAAGAVFELPAGTSAIFVMHGAAGSALIAELIGLGDTSRRIGGLGNCHTSALLETSDGWSLRHHDRPT